MKKLTCVLALLFICQITFSQTFFETALENYRNQTLPEKVFLHTDKEVYAAGENIWMAAYLLNGQTHEPGTYSHTVHVELRDASKGVIQHLKLFAEDGHSAGSISIPSDIAPGSYALFAYTKYQLNDGEDRLFSKRIRIVEGLNADKLIPTEGETDISAIETLIPQIKLRFFPEGGECLENVICKIAVVAENEWGNGVAVDATLIDSEGNNVSEIKTNKYGVGLINLIPIAGYSYFGQIENADEKFELPSALPAGFQLGVIHSKDKYRISAKTNEGNTLQGTRVTINLRGIPLLNHIIEEDLTTAILDIPESDLFAGVVTVTLFDKEDQPMSERLFFVAPSEFEAELDIETNKEAYNLREPVDIDFLVPKLIANENQKDSLARLSYTVVPDLALHGPENENIVTWLLLNSDLKDRLSLHDSLLMAATRLDEKILDDLMLTRGWRRFKWEALRSKKKYTPEYLVETGVYVMGKMGVHENANKARPGKVFLSNVSTALSEERMTDEEGNFIFGPYVTFDTLQVLIQGRYKAGRKNRLNEKITKNDNEFVELTIMPQGHLDLGDRLRKYLLAPQNKPEMNYKDLSDRMLTISQSYDSLSIVLDVIDLKAKRIVKKEVEVENRTSLYANSPDNRVVMDSIPGSEAFTSILEVLRMIPGIRISGSYGNESVLIRGFNSITLSSEPAYFFDGVEVDLAFLRNYPMVNVDFVDVIKGTRASIFGSSGANGVILVYSRNSNGVNNVGVPGEVWTQIEGYHKQREFPVFDPTVVGNQNRPDIRTTIFWNPLLFTDKKAKAKDRFNTSDQTGKFHVIAQGLTYDGRPVFGSTSFEVQR